MTPQESDSRAADRLWTDYARSRNPQTRDALVHQFERLAYSIAKRYAPQLTEKEDLFQVALLGLVKAVDRFDPATHYRFSTFAVPTIVGEIKHHFRDHSRPIQVPRALQKLAAEVSRSNQELTQRLGRPPQAVEVAASLGIPEDQVLEALAVDSIGRPISLDREAETDDSGERHGMLEECLGMDDAHLAQVEHRISVSQALRRLSEPYRTVIELRYFSELTQCEVAQRLGVSQMNVSRMERRALERLRTQFLIQ